MSSTRRACWARSPREAAIERTTFLVDAGDQLERFLEANAERIRELGGLVLIDDDPDYLSVAPDGTFRSRTRYQDEATGEWVSETEVIETAAELVELYNPAEVYAAFAEAARQAAGLPEEPTGAEDLAGAAGLAPDERVGPGSPYAGAGGHVGGHARGARGTPGCRAAARRIYDLALTFQERSQQTEARLIEQFQDTPSARTRTGSATRSSSTMTTSACGCRARHVPRPRSSPRRTTRPRGAGRS